MKKHIDPELLKKHILEHPHKESILHSFNKVLQFKFSIKDVLQIVIGASVLAIPVGFTQEVWELGGELHFFNIFSIFIISIMFISLFNYYMYYKNHMSQHWVEFLKRTFLTYIISFCVVALLLIIIERAPWNIDFYLSLKRTILVTFPCSMGAMFANNLRT